MEEWMMWSALRWCGGGDDHGELSVEPESLSATAAVVGFGQHVKLQQRQLILFDEQRPSTPAPG
jgi:hypothetical protein